MDPTTALWLELGRWRLEHMDGAIIKLLNMMLMSCQTHKAQASIIWKDQTGWNMGASLTLREDERVTYAPKSRKRGLTSTAFTTPTRAHLLREETWLFTTHGASCALHLNHNTHVWLHLEGVSSHHAPWLERLILGLHPPLLRWCQTHGVFQGQPHLPRRSRETLLHLLTGASEKEIAWEMGLSLASLHQRVVALYRHFQVQSRAEFMALWLQPPR